MPPEIDTFEFMVGDVVIDIPSGVVAKAIDIAKVKRSGSKNRAAAAATISSTVGGGNRGPRLAHLLKVMPNVELQMRRISVSVIDDRPQLAMHSTLQTLNLTFQTPDNLLAVDVESYTLDFSRESR